MIDKFDQLQIMSAVKSQANGRATQPRMPTLMNNLKLNQASYINNQDMIYRQAARNQRSITPTRQMLGHRSQQHIL